MSSNSPILNTKLYIPPLRPELVSRPRLITRLHEGLAHMPGVILVSAPAGFGKTTLVSEWVANFRDDDQPSPKNGQSDQATFDKIQNPKSKIQNPSVAWLSLDEADNDPVRFLTYLIAALQTVSPELGQSALALLQSPQPPPQEVVLTNLLNDLARFPALLILVLDDYHLVETPAVDEALTFLINHLPLHLRLVIIGRADPGLPLARLRARGLLVELRTADLRFTPAEAAAFIKRVTGLELSPADVAALESRTEGWIAGLQLAALSMQGSADLSNFITAFSGSHRYIIDYLADEVLDRQPEPVKEFLLQTSILNRLTGELCDAVTGQSNGQATLAWLEEANLFLAPLDNERHWYRYHRLFADLLRQRLRQQAGEQGLLPLHQRASRWFEQHGFISEALSHALAAKDLDLAVQFIQAHAGKMVMRGRVNTVWDWFKALPEAVIQADPRLCLGQAWLYFFIQQSEQMELFLDLAEPGIRDQPELWGQALGLRAWIAYSRGNLEQTIAYAEQALALLPAELQFQRGVNTLFLANALRDTGQTERAAKLFAESILLSRAGGNILAEMGATFLLAELQIIRGQLNQAKTMVTQALRRARAENQVQLPATAQLHFGLADILYEQNDLPAAETNLIAGLELSQKGLAQMAVTAEGYLSLARLKLAQGDQDSARQALRQASETTQDWEGPTLVAEVAAERARLWLLQGDLAAASRWQQESGLSASDTPTAATEMQLLVLARLLLAQARQSSTAGQPHLAEAGQLLKQLRQTATAAGHLGRVIKILVLQGQVYALQGNQAAALTAIEQALLLAEPEGYVRVFVDEGRPVAALLGEAQAKGITPGYTKRLLAAFPAGSALPAETPPAPGPATPELPEPLSDREIEVLRLITAGLSNSEIAEELVLAVSTVKRHISNIYGKLNVNSRTQAIARARELKLL